MFHYIRRVLAGGILCLLTIADAAPTSTSSGLPTTAAYFVSGTTSTFAHTTLTATGTDEGVLIVKETGVAVLNDVTLIKTGDTTSDGDSSFTDLNAAVGVETNGTVMVPPPISNVYIHAEGDGSHGIYTGGGTIYGDNLEIYTYDGHGSAIATDQGGGLIVVKDSSAYTYGALSALVYSTGNITVSSLSGTAAIAPVACIDGANSFTLNDCEVSSGTENNGVFQIVSTVSSSTTETAYAYVNGGSVAETNGTYALLFVANIEAYVYFTNVAITIQSGILANITADSDWGTSGDNGGTANVYLTDLEVTGDIYVDDISAINLYLIGSSWTGALNADSTTGSASVYLDSSSTWTLTGDSYVDSVSQEDGSTVITGQYSVTAGAEVARLRGGCLSSL
ncbi:uncharacterized protein BO80DRAFT_495546 [Aspergillus ibericus CBS 121593]|uniref:Pectin lyase-like protein n=1 Tax=Aspergillus ibericus CBS 121593 TaxID=1448316 RepID=A0A395GSZ9_9EURO|nr:hypothetical protein BO80DRAFT_495546 [Aspergillus ibericus CBS 121593]RAK98546.1 hypothetical protein BO80DRAFT_495546 [Aspergillus ibericus CBS 121593]